MNLSPIFYPGRIANPTPRVPEPDFPGLATAYLRNASADEGSLTEMMKDPLLSASAGLAGYLPNHPLVELGCGVGKSALALSKLSRNQIIAIDNDPKALKIANKLKGQNFRNLRFILGDAQ
ncbi:MAG: class I SAM-dependent methyltransferase, partial [Nanoarchaeota archaeon]|nr:class I SAM-dependent methyltransferase [Nanoarchaeota archaeon]